MKRILSYSAAAAWLLAAPAFPQTAGSPGTSVTIEAAQNYVVAARGLQLAVRALNPRGAIIRGRTYQWQVSDPRMAAITGSGMLSGLAPGAVDVTATDQDSGAAAVRRFYVYPGAVTIDPLSTTLQAGDAIQLSAQARDADGKTIPGVPFAWYSASTGVGRISPGGMFTGVSEGRVTVSAAVDMGPAFARLSAFLGIDVLRRADYRVKSLITTAPSSQSLTTMVPTRVSIAGNYVAGLTSLSNGGQAAVLWQNGRLQQVAASGALLNGKVVTRFESVTVNSQGDVALVADTQQEWCEQIFALFPAGAKSPTILDDTTRCSYWNLAPNAIDKQRNLVFRLSNTLYYQKADGSRQTILNVGDHPAGIDTVNGISNWSIAPSGKVLLELQNSANVSLYFSWDNGKLQKLFGVGDQVATFASQWARLPVEIAPDEYVTRIGGSNWASLARIKDGKLSSIAMSGTDGIGWVQDGYGGVDGYLFFYADTNGKTSLFRNKGGVNEVLATYADWRELSQLTATGGDSAIVYGTLGTPTPNVVRFAGTASSVVLGPGLTVEAGASPAIAQASIPKGINASGILLRTYGDSLLRASASGVAPILKPGDALGSGTLASLGAVAGNRQGDLAFTAQHGSKMALYIYRAGQFQKVADSDDLLPGGATIWGFPSSDNQIAANNLGHVAAFTYNSVTNGLYLYSGAASSAPSAKLIMRIGTVSPASGATFTSLNSVAIDESDRVAFIANTSAGRTGLFLWDSGSIRELFETGQLDPNGRAYQGLYSLQAGGARFYMRVYVTGMNELLAADGASIKILAYDGYATSFGAVLTSTFGQEFSVNSRGDVVFPGLTASGPVLFVKRADGSDAQVAAASVRGPDGEWFLNLYGAGIGDQGEIVFSGQTWVNGQIRLGLYQASENR